MAAGPGDSQVDDYAWQAQPATNNLNDPEAIMGTTVTKVQQGVVLKRQQPLTLIRTVGCVAGGGVWNAGAVAAPGTARQDDHYLRRVRRDDGLCQELNAGAVP